jgi:hypothetical protein
VGKTLTRKQFFDMVHTQILHEMLDDSGKMFLLASISMKRK